jgi:hypothetical protein
MACCLRFAQAHCQGCIFSFVVSSVLTIKTEVLGDVSFERSDALHAKVVHTTSLTIFRTLRAKLEISEESLGKQRKTLYDDYTFGGSSKKKVNHTTHGDISIN